MQDLLDEEKVQYKQLSKFNVKDENIFRNMTTYELAFHVWAIKNFSRPKES